MLSSTGAYPFRKLARMGQIDLRPGTRYDLHGGAYGMRAVSILVVDDEEDSRASVAALLALEFPGCRVVTADDGEAAIAALDRTRFDLAIIDYKLPYLNGMDVARHAAKIGNGPCVLLTGHADPEIGLEGAAEGVLIGYLHKTASSDEIIAFIRKSLERARRSH